jgi:hypothetical protein
LEENVEEEIIEEKKKITTVSELLEVNDFDKIDWGSLTKEDMVKLEEDITNWIAHELPSISTNNYFEEFKLVAKKYILSEKLEKVLVLREEEVLGALIKSNKELEEFDKIPEETKQKKFLNSQLLEYDNIRRNLPNFFVELETIIPAIYYNKLVKEDSFNKLTTKFYKD